MRRSPARRGRVGSVLIIGSGPVVVGQAAEFDYAGTQACRALREEGIRTVLLNSNPATIMTDPGVADVVYLEPLTAEVAARVIERERPDGILAGLGGQTALNLAMALGRAGVLARTGTRLLGTPLEAIETAEDRQRFRDLLARLGQPYPPSVTVQGGSVREREGAADRALAAIGLPAIVRPAFTLGGWGGGIAASESDYRERVRAGLRASPIGQVIVERCLVGWKEIEYEVMRDGDDTCIAVCSMENVDPLGVHTGDSIVVAPVQTLPDQVHQRLRGAALAIIRALGVEGGCNVQFALSPDDLDYAVIEVNPRVSRSSALASKATGYPIARVAAQLAVGRRLADIPNAVTGTTVAAFEPALDYVVVKLPRFPFDKFPAADRSLGSQMKATGEVMAIDRTFGAALNKALRGLEQAAAGVLSEDPAWTAELAAIVGGDSDGDPSTRGASARLERFVLASDSRIWRLLALLRRGIPVETLHEATGIAPWFLAEMARLVDLEGALRAAGHPIPGELLVAAKRAGFGDRDIATLTGADLEAVTGQREALGLWPGFAMVDTCAAEFAARTPYFYATYAAAGSPPEAPPVARPAALVIGSGPVRIGQGIEFDYCAVQAAATLRAMDIRAVMVNSNPETVSTDFDASARLYFEPLDEESVRAVVRAETSPGTHPLGALVQFGGQTPLNLAAPLAAAGVPLLGLDVETIERAEERVRFAALLDRLGIPQPEGGVATSVEEAFTVAERIRYPVIARPSFVIGGLGIRVAYGPADLEAILAFAAAVSPDRPVRIDAYLEGLEVDVDALADGETVLVVGLIEHVERAGVHSGDSVGIYPARSLSPGERDVIVATMTRLSLALGVHGLVNAQFIVREDGIYVIEANPRASRTVPFLSKVTGVPMVDLATRIALGSKLAELGWRAGLVPEPRFVAVKAPVFSTARLRGVDPSLGPAMQSTGEVIGIHEDGRVAMAKALLAASLRPPLPDESGRLALLSIADRDKGQLKELAAALAAGGYRLSATRGTAEALRRLGHRVIEVARLGDPDRRGPTLVDTIRSGEVRLVVNTPSPLPGPVRDAASIRHAAIAEGILCLTSIETAVAAARSLDQLVGARVADVRPLGEWLAGGSSARSRSHVARRSPIVPTMTSLASALPSIGPAPYGSDDERWRAALERDPRAEGRFWLGVTSTTIFCRPTCPARRPRRERAVFFESPAAAQSAGFRACRRCRPTESARTQLDVVAEACHIIEDARPGATPTLEELGRRVGWSPFHLQRTFRRLVGVSPRQYAESKRLERLRDRLRDGAPVTTALYDAGWGSSAAFYASAPAHLGMSPSAYRNGGSGAAIRYTIVGSPIGRVLLARTDRGICAIDLGDDDERLLAGLRREFSGARLERDDGGMRPWAEAVRANIAGSQPHLDLPLDVRASAFQRRVWEALREIPYGETRTYGQVAAAIGSPGAARAVGRACATNPVAIIVPCHRVVASGGRLGGYSSGLERKRWLLDREAEASGSGGSARDALRGR